MNLLLHYAKPYWQKIICAVLAVTTMAFATLLQPQFLKRMLAAVIADDTSAVFHNGFWLLFLAIVGMVAGVTGTFFASRVSQGVAAALREAEYEKIQSFSLSQIQKFSSANLVIRLTNDINQVQQFTMQLLQIILRVPILFVGGLILAIWTMPNLWWVIVLMIVVIMASTQRIFKQMGGFFGKFQRLLDKNNTITQESLAAVRVVKSFNQQDQEAENFAASTKELTDLNRKISYTFSLMMPIYMLISYLAIAAALLLVSQSILKNPSELAKITPFITYLNQLLFSMLMLGMVSNMASRGMVSLKRIGAVMAEPSTINIHNNDTIGGQSLTGAIDAQGLSFAYPGDDHQVLKDVSFNLPAGKTLGIVGSTGSGKSTLALLLARLYQPDAGQILFDGQKLADLDQATLHENLAIVLQKPVLFSGTIADNLKMGRPDASEADLEKAADQAQASEFINQYPERFDHEVAERSSNLSGGQKQRLSLARALIKQPKILILDDSTSALDARSERQVQDALTTDFAATTKIIIAEKIASIIHADQILVLDQGQVVGIGSHQELLEKSPMYQEIYHSQKGKEDNHG
ncbi:ABC transporter ATP-binding protein [Fructobacillus ficulneus]|uniref:ABC-type multidrug transport system, ATPase and permease component n=1 Tax=Fructobacillus ficulneus TaxID=157463 RepID=A0A0K8MI61_9LACO|nr:ABC transporter ATP-binding protein [Fructobacillus ficulneus]GAO99549.1 ABC-type multidrug transport system, ATPase and permease component [Fructobacillus ficulneus]